MFCVACLLAVLSHSNFQQYIGLSIRTGSRLQNMADHIVKLQGFRPSSIYPACIWCKKSSNKRSKRLSLHHIYRIHYVSQLGCYHCMLCHTEQSGTSKHFSCCVLHWVLDLCHYHSSSCVCTKGNGIHICCKCTTITCSLPQMYYYKHYLLYIM